MLHEKGKAGSVRFRISTHNPNIVTFREPHPGQNVRPTMLHEYLCKLLLSPDEFMRTEQLLDRTCKTPLVG